MGCNASKQDAGKANGGTTGVGGAAAAHRKLNQRLAERARHPSAIPGSFSERERDFRKQQGGAARKAVPPRSSGPCRMRARGLGGWRNGWLELAAHELCFYSAAGAAPEPGVAPDACWELVGAHLRLERKQELVLVPAGGAPPATLALPDEAQAHGWMVALAGVPGLFRRVDDYYELGAAWGQGATCVVRECVGRYTGQRHALKSRVHTSRGATEAMHNELRILQICAKHPHPAIPRLHDYFFDEDGSIELIMDLMRGGELFDHVAAVPQLREADARAIFEQVAAGVAHLHALGIAHRDLKPQNLMYASADEGAQVRIMDYDLSKVNYAPDWEGHTPCGTLHYMAPEIVEHRRYSLAIDLWSLGVILFVLLTGHMPFDGHDAEAVTAAIQAGRYQMDAALWGGVSQAAKDLVRALLQHDPQLRPTAQEVLQHPWLTTQLDPQHSAELPSPMQLRKTFSKTERGRQLLALAASHYSEADLRLGSGAAAAGAPAKPLGVAAAALAFDMQPVREQAGPPRKPARPGPAAANGCGSTAEGGRRGGEVREAEELARLRLQLEQVGTAGGLQDRRVLEARGVALLAGSPRAPAAQRGAQPPHVDSFADLGLLEVEERTLSGEASEDEAAPPGRCAARRRSSEGAAPRVAPLRLPPLPPPERLPRDEQLLLRLAGRGNSPARQRAGGRLPRTRSAFPAAGGAAGLPRSGSASSLDSRAARIPAAQREPVERAMARKQQRLERMRTASPTPAAWLHLAEAAPRA